MSTNLQHQNQEANNCHPRDENVENGRDSCNNIHVLHLTESLNEEVSNQFSDRVAYLFLKKLLVII